MKNSCRLRIANKIFSRRSLFRILLQFLPHYGCHSTQIARIVLVHLRTSSIRGSPMGQKSVNNAAHPKQICTYIGVSVKRLYPALPSVSRILFIVGS